jgi:hypothetical protein
LCAVLKTFLKAALSSCKNICNATVSHNHQSCELALKVNTFTDYSNLELFVSMP